MRVLALDPGESVGWARADIDDGGVWTEFRHGITGLRDMALAVYTASVPTGYDWIVVEDWRLYPHLAKSMVGSSFPSVKFIGAVELCCWLSGTRITMQGARIKKIADQAMSKADPELYAKVTQPGSHADQHDLDAIRHLWYWDWKRRLKETT